MLEGYEIKPSKGVPGIAMHAPALDSHLTQVICFAMTPLLHSVQRTQFVFLVSAQG